jgi:hypothetical protein
MIDYNTYRKFYVDANVFTLSGESYTGYVETINGIPYVYNPILQVACQEQSSMQEFLTPLNNYQSDLLTSTFFFDRLVNDDVTLPHSLNDVTIQANDFLSEEVINKKISLLKDNNTFCFSRLFIPNNDIPYNTPVYASFNTLSSSSFTVLSSISTDVLFSDSVKPELADIKGFVCANSNSNDTEFVMFAYTDTSIITLTGADNSLDIISSSNLYQDNIEENTQAFSRIGGLCIENTLLFVTDADNNAVLKYDISTYLNKDTIFIPSKVLIEVIGAKGKISDSYKFNIPTFITSSRSNIFVFDSNNLTIKVYDLNFNFITRINAINFKSEQLVALEYNKINNLLYALTQPSGSNLKLYVINNDFKTYEVYELTDKLLTGETVKNITFSYNDSNIFYICTNFNVYKKLINRPEYNIGRFTANRTFRIVDIRESGVSNLWNYVNIPYKDCNFKWNLISTGGDELSADTFSDSNRGIFITPQTDDSDKFFIITGSKIFFFKETMSYKRVLKTENVSNFGRADLNLFGTEYVQASTLNKEVYKLVTDIFLLKNNIRGRFYGKYDNQGILVLDDYNYNIDYTDFFDTITESFFIHENEKAITGVINRVLTQIYDLQYKLIKLTEVDKEGSYAPVFNSGSLQPSNVLIID